MTMMMLFLFLFSVNSVSNVSSGACVHYIVPWHSPIIILALRPTAKHWF